jgi:hypothetical protein
LGLWRPDSKRSSFERGSNSREVTLRFTYTGFEITIGPQIEGLFFIYDSTKHKIDYPI